ncbi:MAG: archease [Gammaproteobacteria bacterium]|jgi:tRNA nucleotidyltransferase (CCA-adding enzyme)
MANHWEHFEHGADIGVRGFGDSLSAAFEQTALAMAAVVTDPDSIDPRNEVDVECDAPDAELLLVDWLNAVVYEMATRRMLFSRFDVQLEGNALRASLWGEEVSIEKHRPAVEIKGATYTNLSVRQLPDREWVAECVVDV